jgi:YbbR domain-containing protein
MARARRARETAGWIDVLRGNLGAKVLAAAVAFALWFFVNAGQRDTQVFEFPIEFKNLPEGAIVANPDRFDTVDVKLNGPGALLASLDARRFPIGLDLSDAPVGPGMRRKIREHMIHLPRGVRILEVVPSRVPVRLEPLVRRTVPVVLSRTGKPRAGYRIRELEVIPREIAASGPASLVDKLALVETEPVELDGLAAGTTRTVALVRGDSLLVLEPARVTVRVEVEEVTSTREFAEVPIAVLNVNRPFRLRPTHVKLTVRGPKEAVEALALEPNSVFVDGAKRGSGDYVLKVESSLPAGVKVVSRDPASVQLRILESDDGAE